MTIEKGADWGRAVARPDGLRIASSDAELAALLTDGSGRPTAASSGDLFKTMGSRQIGDRTELMAFPVDLVEVAIDERASIMAVAHVVAQLPTRQGGRWRGPILAVMNAEFIDDYDVAPRGHPNDGRVETFQVAADMSVRQRWELRRRLRSARHLPHPQIATRSVRTATIDFDQPMRVAVDGVATGSGRSITVRVHPDAALVHS